MSAYDLGPRRHHTESDDAFLQVRWMSRDWFRSADGTDESVFHGLSVGSILSCFIQRNTSAVLSSVRHASARRLSNGKIHLPEDASALSVRISEKVGEPVRDLAATQLPNLHDYNDIASSALRIPVSAATARVLQPLFRRYIRKRRTLWVPSWVSLPMSRSDPDGLILYRKSFLKSAIPIKSEKLLQRAEEHFPYSLAELSFPARVVAHPATAEWSSFEKELVVNEMEAGYQKIRRVLVGAAAQFDSLLDFYTPTQANLLDDAFEHWILMYELCRLHSIPTAMYVDGYQVTPISPHVRTHDGTDLICDRLVAYGSAQARMYLQSGVSDNKVEIIEPPFYCRVRGAASVKNWDFEVVVLTWTPFLTNPAAVPSSPPDTLRLVLRTLKAAGFKRIAVKIRWAPEEPYVAKVLDELNLEIPILSGKFMHHVLTAAPLYIGGISTTFAEAAFAEARYIVFEPLENGYPDSLVAQATVTDRRSIARSEAELETLLLSQVSSWTAEV